MFKNMLRVFVNDREHDRWTGSFARHGSIPLDRAYERGEKLKGNRNGSRAWKRERERERKRRRREEMGRGGIRKERRVKRGFPVPER